MSYDDTNVFAKILRGEMPSHRVFEDEATIAFMDVMPRGDGHALVIPRAPVRNLLDADDATIATVHRTAARVARAAMRAFGADGVTVQQFNEPAGGQVVFHYHVHVIPRFKDVALRPHTGDMADGDVLAAQAGKLRAAIDEGEAE